MARWLKNLQNLDWWLIGAVLLLTVSSTTILYGIHPDSLSRQVTFLLLGLVLLFVFSNVNYRYLQNYAYFLYIGGIILLVGVLLFGTEIRNTTGWFQVAGFSFQPVELAKVLLLITLARFFSDHTFQFSRWRTIALAFAITLAYTFLVLLQPDLGSMAVFTIAFLGLLLITDIRKSQIAAIVLSGITVIIFAWFFVLQPYQQDRILTFVDPSRDPLGSGYNVTQSIISVGSGQWSGRGLGLGTQSQLQFLPERDTDFIFAVIAEELGFFGAGSIILLLAIIVWRLWVLMRVSQDAFSMYYAIGLAIILFVQSFINIGMNMGISPVTGIPLPFVSAGGSSLLTLMMAVGIAQNCWIQTR